MKSRKKMNTRRSTLVHVPVTLTLDLVLDLKKDYQKSLASAVCVPTSALILKADSVYVHHRPI